MNLSLGETPGSFFAKPIYYGRSLKFDSNFDSHDFAIPLEFVHVF
jgi:hypothetical protein